MKKKELIFVTGNKYKHVEIAKILEENVKLVQVKGQPEEPDLAKIEDIAVYKARQAYKKLKKPVIVEDTGVYFSEYNDFPGHLAKRIYEGIGLNGLITLVKAAKNKKGYFKSVICYKASKEEVLFSGVLRGRFLTKLRKPKANRLPYEKMFVPDNYKKAVVELSLEEKNKISHRAKAARKLKKWLEKNKF